MQARRKLVSSLSGWAVRGLLPLSSCSARKCADLMWMWSFPSRGTAHEEVFWSLAVSVVVFLMRRLLMRVFSAEFRSSFLPWAEVGPLKGPRSRWTGIHQYPEHRQTITTPHTTPGRPRAHIRTKVLLCHILETPLHGRARIDLHLGQKPKLGGRYADGTLIYI
jgi:hypothetical protein